MTARIAPFFLMWLIRLLELIGLEAKNIAAKGEPGFQLLVANFIGKREQAHF
jgi:hypothetical protein